MSAPVEEPGAGWSPEIRRAVDVMRTEMRAQVLAFGERFAATVADEVRGADPDDLRRYLAGYLEERFAEESRTTAETLIGRMREFVAAHAAGGREMSPAVLRTRAEPVRHDTFRYDAGVFAVGAVGLTVMAVSSVALGGVIALGAPVLAKVFRDRANEELRAKAVSEVPRVVQRMAEQLADNFDREIARWASDVTASARAS